MRMPTLTFQSCVRIGCVAFVAGAHALGCGGSVANDSQNATHDGGGGKSGSGGSLSDAGKKDAKTDAPSGGKGGTAGKGGSGGSGGTFVDPGCPDAAPPPTQFDCDPYGPNNCPAGQACIPFVNYPTKPCDFEIYGATCGKTGVAVQGDACGNVTPGSVSLCAPGFLCVITGQGGSYCVELCKLDAPNTCPKGLLCLPVDVEGIGGCD